MILPKINLKIIGTAGTGKTTRLLQEIQRRHGDQLDDVTYITFNRAAAAEARKRLGISKREAWVGTIHSIFTRLLHYYEISDFVERFRATMRDGGIEQIKVRFFRSIGVEYDPEDREGETLGKRADYIKTRILLSGDPRREMDLLTDSFPQEVEVARQLLEYLEENGYVDYDHAVAYVYKERVPFATSAVYVDEAQDLSPLEYNIIARHHGFVAMAGDYLQAIYLFRGARPELFLNTPAEEIIELDKTYRLPQNIWDFAVDSFYSHLGVRVPHVRSVRSENGEIQLLDSFVIDVAMEHAIREADTGRTVFFLTRTNEMARKLRYRFVEQFSVLPNVFKDIAKYRRAFGFVEAVKALKVRSVFPYMQKYLGEYIDKQHIQLVLHGLLDPLLLFDREKFVGDLGGGGFSARVLEALENERLRALRNLYVDTMHSVKGAECDSVYVLDDLPNSVWSRIMDADTLHSEAMLYGVAATRGRQKLVIIRGSQSLLNYLGVSV